MHTEWEHRALMRFKFWLYAPEKWTMNIICVPSWDAEKHYTKFQRLQFMLLAFTSVFVCVKNSKHRTRYIVVTGCVQRKSLSCFHRALSVIWQLFLVTSYLDVDGAFNESIEVWICINYLSIMIITESKLFFQTKILKRNMRSVMKIKLKIAIDHEQKRINKRRLEKFPPNKRW